MTFWPRFAFINWFDVDEPKICRALQSGSGPYVNQWLAHSCSSSCAQGYLRLTYLRPWTAT